MSGPEARPPPDGPCFCAQPCFCTGPSSPELLARAEAAERQLAEIARRCDVREADNPFHEPGRHEVPTWILVADIRDVLDGKAPDE